MSKLIFGITRIVSRGVSALAREGERGIAMAEFAAAYEALRASTPGGDLHIHLYVLADSASEVGAKFQEGVE